VSVIWRGPSLAGSYGVKPVSTVLVTAPVAQVISDQQAMLHLRVTNLDEVELIEMLIESERLNCEAVTDLKLITQTWDAVYDEFPTSPSYPIWLPSFAPIQTITSVTYTDSEGDSQVWSSANYVLVKPTLPPGIRRPGYLLPVSEGEFPSDVLDYPRAITVRLVAGFGLTGASVPKDLIMDMLANIGTRFTEGRQTVVAGSIVSRVPDVGLYHNYRPAV
jgi:uncharacterized phiE125 gp8 family phage protein